MLKKLTVKVKAGEEMNKATKPRKTFLSSNTTIFGKIGTNQV